MKGLMTMYDDLIDTILDLIPDHDGCTVLTFPTDADEVDPYMKKRDGNNNTIPNEIVKMKPLVFMFHGQSLRTKFGFLTSERLLVIGNIYSEDNDELFIQFPTGY
jgi:hypothetical protein